MSNSALRLKDELLQLSADDRAELAHLLWESLDTEEGADASVDEAGWTAELERRSADADAGRAAEEPFRDVIAELRKEQP